MSLSLFIAHSGEHLSADPVSIGSLDALKRWIHETAQIPVEDQILLTARGKHVKLQTLLTENEIFIYDRLLFAQPADDAHHPALPPSPEPDAYHPTDPPDTLASQTSLKSWHALFAARRDWAAGVARDCTALAATAARHFTQRAIVERALAIATGNHEPLIRALERKCEEAREWFAEESREHRAHMEHWEADVERLAQVPAAEGFRASLSVAPQGPASDEATTLASFVDVDTVRTAVAASTSAVDAFSRRIADLRDRIAAVATEYDGLMEQLHQSRSRSAGEDMEEPAKLLEEIEVVARKVTTDQEHVAALPANPKSVAQVSKMALLHTRNHLPTLTECAVEMGDLARRAVQQKNAAVRTMLDHMRLIAALEGRIDALKREFGGLEVSPDLATHFDTVAWVGKLPLIYGNLIIEAVRRREWTEKMTRDTEALAEDLAGYQEEEQRRRKKWHRAMGDVLRAEAGERKVLGVEVNLQGGEEFWPAVAREDVETYIQTLSRLGFGAHVTALTQSVKDLDKPTRSQIKRAKAFKNGSVHEGFGKGSLMLRGEDDNRALREANARLEDELRGQKSRVRKLEDLLHRQSHINRVASPTGSVPFHAGSPFEPPSTPALARLEPKSPSPRQHDDLSRRSLISARRLSANQSAEDRAALVRKIMTLEAELATEKAAREALERDAADRAAERRASEAKVTEMQRLMAEANSTKEDLMQNMEAQAREWAGERKHLVAELERAKEEYEEDLDRLMASREQERAALEERADSSRKDGEALVGSLEGRLQKAKEKAEEQTVAMGALRDALRFVLRSLSKDDVEVPADDAELAAAVRDIVDDALRMLVEKSSMISDQLKDAQVHIARVAGLEADAATHREEADTLRRDKDALRAELAEMRGRFDKGQQELRDLARTLEAKQSGDAAETAQIRRLTAELAESKSHINALDVQLLATQRTCERLTQAAKMDSARLAGRGERARRLTQQLYVSTERLHRLVETLGFTIAPADERGTLGVQRASKVSASGTLADGSIISTASGSRSLATPSPMKRALDELADAGALDWASAATAEEEAAKFAACVAALDRFPLGPVCDAVAKRQRDVEHTARKWQKESRTYRERAHRHQHESHEKIAYRSFKEGDLALFLPTRNQARGAWAAFNVGAPHYFLREQESHRLAGREWLVARIGRIEERVVDLSRSLETHGGGGGGGGKSAGGHRRGTSIVSVASEWDDDNPFDLSDGLRWYLLDATEDRPHPVGSAPIVPRAGTATVAHANVDATGLVGHGTRGGDGQGAAVRTLGRLDERAAGPRSRRDSENSRRSVPPPPPTGSKRVPGAEGVAEDHEVAVDSPEPTTTTTTTAGQAGEEAESAGHRPPPRDVRDAVHDAEVSTDPVPDPVPVLDPAS